MNDDADHRNRDRWPMCDQELAGRDCGRNRERKHMKVRSGDVAGGLGGVEERIDEQMRD
jgi:hypothetical protein